MRANSCVQTTDQIPWRKNLAQTSRAVATVLPYWGPVGRCRAAVENPHRNVERDRDLTMVRTLFLSVCATLARRAVTR